MWMLHDGIVNFSKCLCECYMITLSTSHNVYVNVTLWQYNLLKMFMWMLHDNIVNFSQWHDIIINFSQCSCECYMITLSTSHMRTMFMRMLHRDIICFSTCLFMFAWMLHRCIIKFSQCSCECYMIALSISQNVNVNDMSWLYQLLQMFM
jgi:hypothetical protein